MRLWSLTRLQFHVHAVMMSQFCIINFNLRFSTFWRIFIVLISAMAREATNVFFLASAFLCGRDWRVVWFVKYR